MPKPDSQRLRWPLFLIIVPLIVAADQITKAWIRSYPEGSVIFQQGFVRIVHISNSGAAFGLFQSGSTVLMFIAIAAVALILAYFFFLHKRFVLFQSLWGWVALSMVCAGATGNLIDRLNPGLNGITDFAYVWIWPAFNVADSSITVGVIVLAITVLFSKETPADPA
jgi:signal peptidase II